MDLPKLFYGIHDVIKQGCIFSWKIILPPPEARFYGFMSVSFAKLGKVNDFFGEKYKFVGKKY